MSRHDASLHLLTIAERLAGLPQTSPVARALRNRPELLDGLEASYRALFENLTPAQGRERLAIALFTASLHGDEVVTDHFHQLLAAQDNALARLVALEAANAALPGPYGTWPPGPLSAEDLDGPVWRADPEIQDLLGHRLAAAFAHAHLITLHPRDASEEALQALAEAGWTPDEIPGLNGLIAFLGALSPVVAGLRAYAFARQPHLLAGAAALAASKQTGQFQRPGRAYG
ncbi:CMD domain protein [Xinfangfangia sp. D13-10-4-6]|uniref:CMD domain protein n=1 Tax=Pseudogemmobacter hezensis TaxID=2737662 RepID=UPI00155190EF|nr:CMD domain protein [Pseudogemmobacter hezensis]NPD16041.1 CMD domain protein [Pseudogemmobacter hezensis]